MFGLWLRLGFILGCRLDLVLEFVVKVSLKVRVKMCVQFKVWSLGLELNFRVWG